MCGFKNNDEDENDESLCIRPFTLQKSGRDFQMCLENF